VITLGYRNDIPNLLDAMDILVVPSLWEPLGVIVMEGMAMKKPIVATNAGGVPEMVRDGKEALLVPPSAPTAIAEAVESLFKSEQMAQRLADAGFERLRSTFAPESAASRYQEVYMKLLSGTRPDRAWATNSGG
jgi:glycosyltransferase involved in cell wall biosynthesis